MLELRFCLNNPCLDVVRPESFTAGVLNRSKGERGTGTPSMTAGSPGMVATEKKTLLRVATEKKTLLS